ncbi:MAG: DNA translocase FtsK, partial [Phycisphaerales bacterium]
MARRSTQAAAESRIGVTPRRIGWFALATLWLFAFVSLVSHHPADAPGHTIAPLNAETANWGGPAGAFLAHHFFLMLDAGAWVLLVGAAFFLVVAATGRRVSQPGLRMIGVLMVALAIAGFQALMFPGAGAAPQGAGGLAGIVSVQELSVRSGPAGTTLALLLVLGVGAIVAFDHWLAMAPLALWRAARAGATGAQKGATALAAARANRVRENDLDDDPIVEAKPRRRRAAAVVEEDDEEAWDEEDDEEEAPPKPTQRERRAAALAALAAEDDDELPGAPQVFDPDQLREKMSKLPVRFAAASRRPATEEDLLDIQTATAAADDKYVFPGLDLLLDPEDDYSDKMESFVREQATALEEALRVYRIEGEVVGIDSGPVITLYEVKLAPGTKVSQINSLAADLARAMKVVNVRIVPNLEGRDTIGIEAPNIEKERVRLKELMTGSEKTSKMRLPLFLGKDASGAPLIYDLADMPHMLIAGTTGSGKSVCINAIIMGFLYTKKPGDLKLVLVDPKMVEMSQFRDIPHLMCPVVTEMGKAAAILEWAVTKMDERYELLAEAGCRDIDAYNGLGWDELKDRFSPASEAEEARIPRKLPRMVFMIDELADLMMTNKEVESSIVRIAQKARAVGIHLILATQRPQANVVTGLIKSNMPSRICFKVASGMDSRIVMDQKGGEVLLGQGDMLFLTPRSSKMLRAQGTLVEDVEIRRVVRFLKDVSAPSFERQLMQLRGEGDEEGGTENWQNSAQEDPLFDKAVEIVLESRRGSVSLLQRRLAIGYTRASRLIDLMGMAGIIGEHKGSVAREVMISPEEWAAMKAQAEQDAADGTLFAGDPAHPESRTRPARAAPDEDDAAIDAEEDDAAEEDDEEYEYEYVDEDGDEEEYEDDDESEDE